MAKLDVRMTEWMKFQLNPTVERVRDGRVEAEKRIHNVNCKLISVLVGYILRQRLHLLNIEHASFPKPRITKWWWHSLSVAAGEGFSTTISIRIYFDMLNMSLHEKTTPRTSFRYGAQNYYIMHSHMKCTYSNEENVQMRINRHDGYISSHSTESDLCSFSEMLCL